VLVEHTPSRGHGLELGIGQGESRHLSAHLDGLFLLFQTHLPFLLLLLQALDGQLPLNLQVLLLLLPHDLQLLGQLYLTLALSLLCCPAQLFPVLLAQGTQCPPGITDLCQLVLQSLTVQPALVQLAEELEQLRVHAVNGLEEGEHGRPSHW
jgi:hypothetical protein